MRSDRTRALADWGQGGSASEPIRLRGVQADTLQNRRLKWVRSEGGGGSYSPSTEEIEFFEPDKYTPKQLAAGEEAWVIFRTAANRYEEIGAAAAAVYEFRNCTDPALRLFLDNATVAEHDAGEVAVINIDGVYDCWRLYGPAPFCKTGECAVIMAWGADCNACNACFYLTPCAGGSPTFVRGIEWFEYVGGVVLIDVGAGEACYTVNLADGCFDVTDYTVDDVVRSYADCNQCGCYELTNCADSEDVIYVGNDLAAIVGAASGAAAVGSFVKNGACYEITDFLSPCAEELATWADEDITRIESCSTGCCYLLTPCPDQVGDPPAKYYQNASSDTTRLQDFVNDDGTSNGRVLRLVDDVCYSVSVPEVCDAEEVIVGLGTVKEEYDECGDCIETCWERCDSPGTFIRTYTDLSDVGPNAAVMRAEDYHCYKRATLSECDGDPLVALTPVAIFDLGVNSCTVCQTPKVKLTPSCGSGCGDCAGGSSGGSGSGASTIVTNDAAFFEHVGKYVKMEGVCRLVEWTTDALVGTVGCWTGPFTSCEACAAAPSQITVIALVDGKHKNVTLQGVFNVCGQSDLSPCETP